MIIIETMVNNRKTANAEVQISGNSELFSRENRDFTMTNLSDNGKFEVHKANKMEKSQKHGADQ